MLGKMRNELLQQKFIRKIAGIYLQSVEKRNTDIT